MPFIIGLIIVLLSVLFGVYVGVWLMFIGGIVEIIEAIKATPVDAMNIAVGLAKVWLAGPAGVIVGAFGVLGGIVVMDKSYN